MGRQLRQPPYMDGQPRKPPYMGGPSSFTILSQPEYIPIVLPIPYGYDQYPHASPQIQFLATLDLLDLTCLTNNPIQHALFWQAIPTKLLSDILKFDGKLGEDPNNHVMTFHFVYNP